MNVVNLNSVRQIHSGNNRKYLRQQFLYIYPKLSRIFTRTVKSSNEEITTKQELRLIPFWNVYLTRTKP